MAEFQYMRGKVVVVTGATGGLGAAICNAAAIVGASVVVGFNRSTEAAGALVAALPAAPGAKHLAVALPVTDSAALAEAAALVQDVYGRVDAVVNSAGTTRFVSHGDLDALDDALFDEILTTNIRGPYAVVRAFRGLLEDSGDSVVVNISSIAGQTAMGSNIAYCASKAALDNMTRSLARALAPDIRVLSVSPGLVDTDFVKSMDRTWSDRQRVLTPLGRLARPEEVAEAVLAAIASLGFTTGIVLPVDGGRPLM